MRTLGITGGIGAGKSTVGTLLRGLGVATVDTDEVAREVVQPGRPALEEIKKAFGDDLVSAGGQLERTRLAQVVFADPRAQARLEEIVHPRIHAVWQAEVGRWRSAGCQLGAVIIPLLFEKDLARHFSLTVCVACTEATQRRRLKERGWSDNEIRDRLGSQLPMRRKIQMSDCILWNEGSLRTLQQQLQCLLKQEPSRCLGIG